MEPGHMTSLHMSLHMSPHDLRFWDSIVSHGPLQAFFPGDPRGGRMKPRSCRVPMSNERSGPVVDFGRTDDKTNKSQKVQRVLVGLEMISGHIGLEGGNWRGISRKHCGLACSGIPCSGLTSLAGICMSASCPVPKPGEGFV